MDLQLIKSLLEVSRRMAETRDLNPLLTFAIDIALEMFNAERGFLVLVNDDNTFHFHVKRNRAGEDIEIEESAISRTIFHRVVSTREPVVTASAMQELPDAPSVFELKLRSVMCVPLIARNRVIGALYLESGEEGIFVKKDVEPLEFFASQAAVSIENAMLNAELEQLYRDRAEELRDISERFQAQVIQNGIIDREALERTLELERARMITNFIQDASHHFRTPLSIINTSVDIMTRKIDSDAYDHYFNNIRSQVNAIVDLVDTLNYMVKLDSAVLTYTEDIKLNDVAHDMYHVKLPRAKEKGVAFKIEILDSNPVVKGSMEYLRQAVGRLIDNAITFTPKGNSVTVRVWEDAQSCGIEVDDMGIGVSQVDFPNIFKRFFRSDTAGTTRGLGVGLSIAKRIMELHDGKIEVITEKNKGSIFRMKFAKGN